jgi:hypothetical protein
MTPPLPSLLQRADAAGDVGAFVEPDDHYDIRVAVDVGQYALRPDDIKKI